MRPEILAAMVEHVGRICSERAQKVKEAQVVTPLKKPVPMLRKVGAKK
jgi:hypothetical protein